MENRQIHTKPLYIIQNDPEVPAGNITETLQKHDIYCQTASPYRGEDLPEPDAISGLIVLGGSMGANDDKRHPFLTPLKQLIRSAVEAQIPYLGICLGGQLLAAALGSAVISNRWEELGTLPVSLTQEGEADPLFSGITSPFITFQWHHDSFDLPVGATLLASSSACPNQAFRMGPSAWGLQFHPEVTEAIIRDWCAWDAETAARTEVLVAHYHRDRRSYDSTACLLLENFLAASFPEQRMVFQTSHRPLTPNNTVSCSSSKSSRRR